MYAITDTVMVELKIIKKMCSLLLIVANFRLIFFLYVQVEILQEKLEMVPVQYSGFAKKRREKNLKREIQALKRQMKLERKISGESSTDTYF